MFEALLLILLALANPDTLLFVRSPPTAFNVIAYHLAFYDETFVFNNVRGFQYFFIVL